MLFQDVYPALLHKGAKVKRPHWLGYWQWDNINRTIIMHCKEGDCLDIRETKDVNYTIGNLLAGDWEILEDDYSIDEVTD